MLRGTYTYIVSNIKSSLCVHAIVNTYLHTIKQTPTLGLVEN